MGCGCNKGRRRPSVRTVGPNSTRRTTTNTSTNIQAQSSKDIQQNTKGMTKEQRDEERRKRIQAISKKRFQ